MGQENEHAEQRSLPSSDQQPQNAVVPVGTTHIGTDSGSPSGDSTVSILASADFAKIEFRILAWCIDPSRGYENLDLYGANPPESSQDGVDCIDVEFHEVSDLAETEFLTLASDAFGNALPGDTGSSCVQAAGCLPSSEAGDDDDDSYA